MAEILVGGDKRRRLPPREAWRALTKFAVLFMCAGLIDTGFAVIPITPESSAWRFGTGVGIIAGLPVLVLGLTIFAMASAMLGRTWGVGLATLLAGLLALGVGLLIALVVTALPDVLEAAQAADQLGLRKGAARALALAVLYGSVVAGVFVFGVVRLQQAAES